MVDYAVDIYQQLNGTDEVSPSLHQQLPSEPLTSLAAYEGLFACKFSMRAGANAGSADTT